MGKLLSDIDLSRSVPVASFLELEAAARSCRCLPPLCRCLLNAWMSLYYFFKLSLGRILNWHILEYY